MDTKVLIIFYLIAIVAANTLIAIVGQNWLWLTAFVLIPFDLVARDVLHDRWRNENIKLRMTALILGGSFLSFVVNFDSKWIALASCLSFFVSETLNAILYQFLIDKHRFVKMNVANSIAAAIDSVLFPFIAFHFIEPGFSLRQCLIKLAGGLFWSILIRSK